MIKRLNNMIFRKIFSDLFKALVLFPLMFSIKYLFWMIIILPVIFGCSKKESVKPDLASTRTVMVYMAANNNLNGDAYTNINQMEAAYKGIEGKLIVYARLKNVLPAIYEISYDQSSSINSKIIKTYNEHNSSDPLIMSMVIKDMMLLAQTQSYGLILWSHATSWLPAKTYTGPSILSFGDDAGAEMDIRDLKNALPEHLDFLLFDACSMASTEVLFELKDKARYIIASPAEVISVGMPYHKMLQHLFSDNLKEGLTHASHEYYQYYQEKVGLYQSATISLIDCSKLDKLATVTSNFLKAYSSSWPTMKRDEIQRLDFDPDSPTEGFDYMDFYVQNFPTSDLNSLLKALEETIVFTANTPLFNGTAIKTYSGLSMYIPSVKNNTIHPYYQSLNWYTASSAYILFNKI